MGSACILYRCKTCSETRPWGERRKSITSETRGNIKTFTCNTCHKSVQECTCMCVLFSPVKSQSMQESRETFHDEKNRDRQDGEKSKDHHHDHTSHVVSVNEGIVHHHHPKHFRQLCKTQEQQDLCWYFKTPRTK